MLAKARIVDNDPVLMAHGQQDYVVLDANIEGYVITLTFTGKAADMALGLKRGDVIILPNACTTKHNTVYVPDFNVDIHSQNGLFLNSTDLVDAYIDFQNNA